MRWHRVVVAVASINVCVCVCLASHVACSASVYPSRMWDGTRDTAKGTAFRATFVRPVRHGNVTRTTATGRPGDRVTIMRLMMLSAPCVPGVPGVPGGRRACPNVRLFFLPACSHSHRVWNSQKLPARMDSPGRLRAEPPLTRTDGHIACVCT